jgi:hypothetical protein
MSEDDQRAAIRNTNTRMRVQVGQPPPETVLAAVLAVTDYTTPTQVAAIAEWSDAETTWRVFGCTGRILFEVTGFKAVADWYGGREGSPGAHGETVTARAVPLSRLTGMVLELSEVTRGDFGDLASLRPAHGTWRIACETGVELALPTDAHNPQAHEALAEITRTALTAMQH